MSIGRLGGVEAIEWGREVFGIRVSFRLGMSVSPKVMVMKRRG